MKHMKHGVMLLMLLLAAMIIVPMASAAGYDDEKVKLAESNYITTDTAYENALLAMKNFVEDAALSEKWSGATLDREPLAVYDLNGAVLAYQFIAEKNGIKVGVVNAAASTVAGGPVLSMGPEPVAINEQGTDRKIGEILAAEGPDFQISSKTLVAYNFPRLGVLITLANAKNGQTKRFVIDAYDYSIIPEKRTQTDGDLGAWSYYDDITVDQMYQNINNHAITRDTGKTVLYATQKLLSVTRYDQTSENWCAVTVAQMISQYYGYTRTQQAIANIMGNGDGSGSTPAMELTYYETSTGSGGLGKTNSLDVYSPYTNWNNAADEIDANRPLKVGNLGHARTVSGYKTVSGAYYLYVNDPAPGWGSYWILYSSPYNNYVYVR